MKKIDCELDIQGILREYSTISKDRVLLNVSELSELILEKLEDNGMLPPPRGNLGAFDTVEDEIDCSWEPEND